MNKPSISNFNTVTRIFTQKYERYLPTTFDESMTLLEKMNKVIIYLNQIGELTNQVVEQWNEVMDWLLNQNLKELVEAKLEEWLADGTLQDILEYVLLSDYIRKDWLMDQAKREKLTFVIGAGGDFEKISDAIAHV